MSQPELKKTETQEKYNIVGLVVNTATAVHSEVESTLGAVSGVDICATESGKLVVTVDEYETKESLVDTITLINNTPGVIATSIAYHHFEGNLPNQEKQR